VDAKSLVELREHSVEKRRIRPPNAEAKHANGKINAIRKIKLVKEETNNNHILIYSNYINIFAHSLCIKLYKYTYTRRLYY
jgi:hypothetical protein